MISLTVRTLAALTLGVSVVSFSPLGQTAVAQKKDAIRVRILPYLGYAAFHIAKAEGYFAGSGLDVEFNDAISAVEAVPALARGDVDVLAAAITPGLLNAIARGARIRFVSSQTSLEPGHCSYMGLLVSQAHVARGALSDASKLRGLRLGYGQSFAVSYLLEKTMAPLGLKSADLQIVSVPENIIGESLRQGRLDLAVAGEPSLTRALSAGGSVLWKRLEDVAPGLDFSAILFGPRLLDKDPEIGVRFMTAYLRGVRQYNEGKTARNVEILAAATHLAPEELRRACWPSTRGNAALNGPQMLEFQQWMVAGKFLDRPLTLDQFVDPTFVERANRALSDSGR